MLKGGIIVSKFHRGQYRDIENIIPISHKTVKNIITKYKNNNNILKKPYSSYSNILNKKC